MMLAELGERHGGGADERIGALHEELCERGDGALVTGVAKPARPDEAWVTAIPGSGRRHAVIMSRIALLSSTTRISGTIRASALQRRASTRAIALRR